MCLDCGRGRVPVPTSRYRPDLGRCSRDCGEGILIFRPLFGGRKEKQDKGRGSPAAPPAGHTAPQCGAGQRVAGSSAGGRKWGQKREGDITLAVNIPEALLSQGKNRGQSGDCPGFPERRTSLCSDIPSKIAALETIGPPPKIDTQFKEKGIAANAALLTMN